MLRWLPSLVLAALTCASSAQVKFSHPDRVRYDGQCFTIDGKDTFIFSGAFHYFRCPEELWRERFKAIKAAGFNAVETYVAWNWSEQQKPNNLSDFSHMRLKDLDDWLTMAEKEFGLYTIVRPGPYICSEWATGGYPNWLIRYKPAKTKRNEWFRSDDPVYLDWCKHWYSAVAKVVGKHQITRVPKGQKGVILWQIENEYDYAGLPDDAKRGQVKALMQDASEAGIDVPYFGCWTHPYRDTRGDTLLEQGFDTCNEYPRWNIEGVARNLDSLHRASPDSPKMITEMQGGWFGQVGGEAAEEQDGINANQIGSLTLFSIAHGLTALNYYMLFGGTNFGDWAGQNITTCYDYNAPLREWGGTGEKYRTVQAIGRMLAKYGSDLTRSKEIASPYESGRADVQIAARQSPSGATYLFLWNKSRTEAATGLLAKGITYELPPFGSNVYRYTVDPSHGEWLVEVTQGAKPVLPDPVRLKDAEVGEPELTGWRAAPEHPTTQGLGVYDSRFIFYRTKRSAQAGSYLWLRNAGGELISDSSARAIPRQGGLAIPATADSTTFVLLNPGWPNGGQGMEAERGVLSAALLKSLPQGVELTDWKAKSVADTRDRTLVGVDVDTTNWENTSRILRPRTSAVLRTEFEVEAPNPKAVISFGMIDDEGWVYLNGQLIGEDHDWEHPFSFPVGTALKKGRNQLAVLVRNNDGEGGLSQVSFESPLDAGTGTPLKWTDRLKDRHWVHYQLADTEIARNEHPAIQGPRNVGRTLIVRSRITFAKPNATNTAWEMRIEAGGDGFLSLNGHPLGRYWEVGPQRGYYLPECWLKDQNVLELTAVPGRLGDRIKAAELCPLPMSE